MDSIPAESSTVPVPSEESTTEEHPCNSTPRGQPILQMFREFSILLDKRHDKYERIVKISRDITIDSKRIIFMLHRHTTDKEVVVKAEGRFQYLRNGLFKDLAYELENEDIFYYLRAFTPGLQEYIEALSLHHYLKTGTLLSHEETQAGLVFEVVEGSEDCEGQGHEGNYRGRQGRGHGRGGHGRGYYQRRHNHRHQKQSSPRNSVEHVPNSESGQEKSSLEGSQAEAEAEDNVVTDSGSIENVPSETQEKEKSPTPPPPVTKVIRVAVPQTDFILGLCDLTGELMRSCVSAVGSRDTDTAFKTCSIVQHIYQGIVGLPWLSRDIQGKKKAMLSSVKKMEHSCFVLRIREVEGDKPFSHFRMFEEDDQDWDSGYD